MMTREDLSRPQGNGCWKRRAAERSRGSREEVEVAEPDKRDAEIQSRHVVGVKRQPADGHQAQPEGQQRQNWVEQCPIRQCSDVSAVAD